MMYFSFKYCITTLNQDKLRNNILKVIQMKNDKVKQFSQRRRR